MLGLITQFAIIFLSVITFFGFVHLIYYYHFFAIKFQFLDSAAQHSLYSGIRLISTDPVFAALILVFAATVVSANFAIGLFADNRRKIRVVGIAALVAAACVLALWFVTRASARDVARLDLNTQTTSLQEIGYFYSADEKKQKIVNDLMSNRSLLVVYIDNSQIIAVPESRVPQAQTSRFATFRIKLGANDVITMRYPSDR